MSDLLILGTDTSVGKTTFSLLWLAAFPQQYEYWKPVETGDSDSELVRRLLPKVMVHLPAVRYRQPIAPPLAAREEHAVVPSAAVLAAARPKTKAGMLVETFGSPFSSLTETELQLALIQRLALPAVLVSSSALGAIGRSLQCLEAMRTYGIRPAAVVLLGAADAFAAEQIQRHAKDVPVFNLQLPRLWTADEIVRSAIEQTETLKHIQSAVSVSRTPSNFVSSLANENDLLARDRRHVWHPYTSLQDPDPPLAVVGAQDEFLHLADGRRVIDGISSWWTILHGHRNPRLLTALQAALAQLDHVQFAGVTHPYAVELAERLLQTAPWPDGRVFYSDNGSTAAEVALKMAYQYWCHRGEPQRRLFIGFEHGYHGDTFGAMAVSRDPVFFGRFEPLLFRAEIVPVDPDQLDAVLAKHKDHVAAVILEPLLQAAGGMRMHSPETLRQIFEVTRQHGVLFIADEVMTGCGRTGTLWAHQAAGIAPDLICTAKTLAGGLLPLAATLASPNIVAAWDTADRRQTFFHGHSFTAHALACAVACANLRILT
ncbi:MAG TPA: aminotransferase class III-fold pyridoxal phosphate-dependent enzyme, partial [Gemmataceae bacterium]|nr:aminotransferase class III-fold pyridoxal phosphate-dependent enzyme [Gemmataceae bacterium]